MAREIILNLGNEQSIFEFDKIDRKDLYGYKKRLYFDQNNEVCKKGLLDLENGSLLKSGYLSSCYVNEEKNLIYYRYTGRFRKAKASHAGNK